MALELVNQLPYDHPYRWDGTDVGGQKLWRPDELGASLALWLDAEDTASITLNGSTVSQWADKSGNARNATQATAANQPTYNATLLGGKPALSFDGADDFLYASDWTLTIPLSIFVLVKADNVSSGSQHYLRKGFTTGESLEIIGRYTNSNIISAFAGATTIETLTGSGLATTNPAIQGFYRADSTAAALQNGIQYDQAVTTEPILDGSFRLRIGASYVAESDTASPGLAWLGLISEVIFVADAAEATRQKVEGYLAWKWGLAANLPVDHPYKTTPPTA